jgi:CHASE2 domain-containing sensor protein
LNFLVLKTQTTIPKRWRAVAGCAAASVILGTLCLALSPVRYWFERLSFDLPCVFASPASLENVAVVVRDEKSYRELDQEYGKLWDRKLYARLLDRLKTDGAKLAVFDVFLSDPGTPTGNAELVKSIHENGRVVLMMDYRDYSGLIGGEPIYPRPEFKEAALGLGLSSNFQDEGDGVVRRMHPGTEEHPTLAWAAAKFAGISTELLQTRMQTQRWLRYPSSLEQLKRISFSDSLIQEAGFFSNKVVFVGGSPRTKLEGEQADEFWTPFRRWEGAPQPGVMIQVVSFLNLMQGSWLERFSAGTEALLIAMTGIVCAGLIMRMRPWFGALVGVIAIFILYGAACWLMFSGNRWWPWMISAGIQVPVAVCWCFAAETTRSIRTKDFVSPKASLPYAAMHATDSKLIKTDPEKTVEKVENRAGTIVITSQALIETQWVPPSVPDHKLLRCIGEGAYGQVWLARDVIGTYHAVKFVYLKTFSSRIPFDREFSGIHHFTPISRMHPGFVNILHVGRNEEAGYFFYIMEVADDDKGGQEFIPEEYSAKTLSSLIRKGRLGSAACVQLGLELSCALEFLHQHRLIHRDIKPANVLYVRNHAKFADVGLVTTIETNRADPTYIGTEGYIPPEGPGTVAADVYSLGKVLYEACMGLDRMRFPDLPTSIIENADPLLIRLNQVILKACEFNPRERYKSAQELHDDLKALLDETV